MSAIALRGIVKRYKGDSRPLFDGLDLEVRDGEFLVLVGPSGCGKTTLLRVIAGLEDIDAGSVVIDGVDVGGLEPRDRDVAMVFQSYALYPHMTVFGNIAYPLRQGGRFRIRSGGEKGRRLAKEEIRAKVLDVASMLDIADLLEKKPRELSGGQRQRVALGRAMVRDPRAFLMDEPLSNLDARLRTRMREEVLQLHGTLKKTFVYVTHDQAEALTMGDRVVVMDGGRIQQIGTPLEVFGRPRTLLVADFIGNPPMNLFDAVREGDALCVVGAPSGVCALGFSLPESCEGCVVGVRPESMRMAASSEEAEVAGDPETLRSCEGFEGFGDREGLGGLDARDAHGGLHLRGCRLEYSELIGAQSILHLSVGSQRFKMLVAAGQRVWEGRFDVFADARDLHFFDKETGTRLNP